MIYQSKVQAQMDFSASGAEQLACLTGGWHWSKRSEGASGGMVGLSTSLWAPFYVIWWSAWALSSFAVQKEGWGCLALTVGIAGHTCHHTVNLLASWTPREWQWWPPARWKMYQCRAWKFVFGYPYFKSISVVGNVIDRLSECQSYTNVNFITFYCTKIASKHLNRPHLVIYFN